MTHKPARSTPAPSLTDAERRELARQMRRVRRIRDRRRRKAPSHAK